MCVCVCVCVQPLNPLNTYYVPGILLAPQNQPAWWCDRCHSSDEETEARRSSAVTWLGREQMVDSRDPLTPELERLHWAIPMGTLRPRALGGMMEGLRMGTARGCLAAHGSCPAPLDTQSFICPSFLSQSACSQLRSTG